MPTQHPAVSKLQLHLVVVAAAAVVSLRIFVSLESNLTMCIWCIFSLLSLSASARDASPGHGARLDGSLSPYRGFVDGDTLEQLLVLRPKEQREVYKLARAYVNNQVPIR